MELIKLNDVNTKIIEIRGLNVILDSDVAALYGVATREINQAVNRNPDKFPEGYIFELNDEEFANLRSQFVTANLRWKISTTNLSKTRVMPKAFTKKGCYMLATILKSPQATQATIAIIEAFEKMQDMSLSIVDLMADHENEQKQKAVIQKSEELFGEIIGNAMETVDTETSFELNLAALKIKHTVKRSKKSKKKE